MTRENCWEFRKCGREPGGADAGEHGVCPAATETRMNGIYGGKNGGRTCWAIAGTMCGGTAQGTYAAKIVSCRACGFYAKVHDEIRTDNNDTAGQESKPLDLVLEHAEVLEREIEHRMQVEASLHRANAKIKLLASITRHDMINKLCSTGLLVDLLKQKYPDNEEALALVNRICVQLQNLEEMIWFSRDYQELGCQEPAWQFIPRVVAGISGWVQAISISMDPSIFRYDIFADPLLSKVFYNLADNAIRHGERVSRIAVRADERDGSLVIVWEDDGVGVAVTAKEKIFSRGYGKNTGLGLFLVREILSITGISITETGIQNRGARFEIVVPAGAYRRHEEMPCRPEPA